MIRLWGWNDWYIHPFTLLYLIMAYFSGRFFEYVLALGIVCFHEMFHYIFARIYDFDIEKVEILPFGAFLSLRDYGLHHIIEEAIMIMAGLCSHFFLYIMIMVLGENSFLLQMNRLVFVFNILPIYPLDGSKLLLLFLSLWMDYQKAIRLQIKLSIFTLCVVCILYLQISYFVVYGYLIYINYQYIKEYRLSMIRLLVLRGKHKLYKKKKMNHTISFYRPYDNYYMMDNGLYKEEQIVNALISKLKT